MSSLAGVDRGETIESLCSCGITLSEHVFTNFQDSTKLAGGFVEPPFLVLQDSQVMQCARVPRTAGSARFLEPYKRLLVFLPAFRVRTQIAVDQSQIVPRHRLAKARLGRSLFVLRRSGVRGPRPF